MREIVYKHLSRNIYKLSSYISFKKEVVVLLKESAINIQDISDFSSKESVKKQKNSVKFRDVDITIGKIFFYNIVFLLPLTIFYFASLYFGRYLSSILKVDVFVAAQIIMIPVAILIFAFIVPYIREKENVRGLRYSLFGFALFIFFLNLPFLIFQKSLDIVLATLVSFGSYITIAFIYSPEVLGLSGKIENYFNKHKQLILIGIYLTIVLAYIFGYANIYHNISLHEVYGDTAFSFPDGEGKSYGTFLYYSLIAFTTIGFGDITPVSVGARLVTGIEAVTGMLINILFIAILLMFISNYSAREERAQLAKEEKALEKKLDINKEELAEERIVNAISNSKITEKIKKKAKKEKKILSKKPKAVKKKKEKVSKPRGSVKEKANIDTSMSTDERIAILEKKLRKIRRRNY